MDRVGGADRAGWAAVAISASRSVAGQQVIDGIERLSEQAQELLGVVTTSGRGGSIVMLNACCAPAPAPPWTSIVNDVVCTVVGVPEMVTQCTPHWRGSVESQPPSSGRRVGPVPPLEEIDLAKNVPTLPGPS